MKFIDCVKLHAETILSVQGESVKVNGETPLTVVFYPLHEEDKLSGGRRIQGHARGILYPSGVVALSRGDRIVKEDGSYWVVLPDENLTSETDTQEGLERARVVYKGVLNE